ncbi:MAG: ComF family protein [Blautia sp.]
MGNGKKSDGAKSLYNAGFAAAGRLIGNFLLDLLYPRRCPVCDDIVVPAGKTICRECLDRLVPVRGPRCFRCSKPLINTEDEFCYDCGTRSHSYERGISVFSYDSVLAKSLYQLKYHNRKEYGVFYGKYAALYAEKQIRTWGIEALIPVPIHPGRLAKRGYNQAQVIAQEMGKVLVLPVETRAVKRIHKTKPQKELGPSERRKNLEKAFAPGKKKIPWKRVLIIDDIYTTGSTIDAVSKVLKKCGVQEVYFLTIAIGSGRN